MVEKLNIKERKLKNYHTKRKYTMVKYVHRLIDLSSMNIFTYDGTYEVVYLFLPTQLLTLQTEKV